MISIIIPAYNEEKYIEKTLKNLKNQDYENKEIIVVCNGCTDNTKKIAQKYTNKVFELKKSNLVKARNYGATKAKGKKLIFLDADTYFTNSNTLKEIADSKAIIGTCKGSSDIKKLKFHLLWLYKNSITKLGKVNGITFCDKIIFQKINGYQEDKQPFENHDLIEKFKKFGKFEVINHKIITSSRRYEQIGFIKLIIFWIKKLIKNDHEYPVVR